MRASLRHAAVIALITCVPVGSFSTANVNAAQTGSRTVGTWRANGAPTAREREMASVVKAWSGRLNASDNAGIANLFSLPATIIQAPFAYRFDNRRQIALWFAKLPCSGKIVRITFNGSSATAVFLLGNRGATHCDGPGTLAAARFEIVDGKIVSWEQLPLPPKPPSAPAV
jgi:hypothetical protein